MKKILFVILSCLALCGCHDNDENFEGEIISTCSVPQIPLDITQRELVLVESEAELNRLFEGHTNELPQIDFRKSKLLLLHSLSYRQIKGIKLVNFTKGDNNFYQMTVQVEEEDIYKDCYWTAAFIIPRNFYRPISLFLNFTYSIHHDGNIMFYFNKK